MDPVQAADRFLCGSAIPEHEVHRRAQRPSQAAERVGSEIAVRGDALGDERVRDLEEQRGGAGAEQDRLAVDPPHLRVRAVEPEHRVGARAGEGPVASRGHEHAVSRSSRRQRGRSGTPGS